MSTIGSQLPQVYPSGSNSLSQFQAAGYAKQQSLKSYEGLDTGFVLQTKEGDQVSLSSSSFSQMDAFMYDSQGIVQTEGGTAVARTQQNSITLASGQSFTFSVNGDLSKDELNDITNLLKGFDSVISKVKDGDISGALDNALNMGSYDSVSSYSAQIHYQQSVEMSSTTAAAAVSSSAGNSGNHNAPSASAQDAAPPPQAGQGKKVGQALDLSRFLKKLLKQFEGHSDKQLSQAKSPLDKLFQQHLDEIGNKDGSGSIYQAIKKAMDDIDNFIAGKTGTLSDTQAAQQSGPTPTSAPA